MDLCRRSPIIFFSGTVVTVQTQNSPEGSKRRDFKVEKNPVVLEKNPVVLEKNLDFLENFFDGIRAEPIQGHARVCPVPPAPGLTLVAEEARPCPHPTQRSHAQSRPVSPSRLGGDTAPRATGAAAAQRRRRSHRPRQAQNLPRVGSRLGCGLTPCQAQTCPSSESAWPQFRRPRLAVLWAV